MLCMAALEVPTASALADPPADRPGYSLTAQSLFEWDPNLFRLPDGVSPRQAGQATDSRGDTVVSPSASIDANFLPGQQRFHVNAHLDRQLLLNNPKFDATDLTYAGTWQWRLGNEWSGQFDDSQQQQRTSFSDAELTQPNMQTTHIRDASVDFRPRPDRRIGLSYSQYVGTNSLGSRQIYDYRITISRAELGLNSGFGSELVFGASTTHGDYPYQQIVTIAPVDNSYRQNQLDASTHYVATEKLQFEALVGYAKRRYPEITQRDFGGLVGHLGIDWEPTAKIQVQLTVARDLNAVTDYDRIYTVSTNTRGRLSYKPTFKTEVGLEGNVTRVRYQGDPQNFYTLVYGRAAYREDRYDGLKFTLAWTPRDRWTIQVAQILDMRNSNAAGFQYRDWMTQLTLQYLIGPWH
jgi:hypothetical protein